MEQNKRSLLVQLTDLKECSLFSIRRILAWSYFVVSFVLPFDQIKCTLMTSWWQYRLLETNKWRLYRDESNTCWHKSKQRSIFNGKSQKKSSSSTNGHKRVIIVFYSQNVGSVLFLSRFFFLFSVICILEKCTHLTSWRSRISFEEDSITWKTKDD